MLTVGTRGSDVSRLQKTLKAAGFDPGGVDGVFGRKTKAAVLKFQHARHLSADGVVGPQTSKKLFGSSNSKYFDGKSDFAPTPPAPILLVSTSAEGAVPVWFARSTPLPVVPERLKSFAVVSPAPVPAAPR